MPDDGGNTWSVLIPYLETSHEAPRPRRYEVEYQVEADGWVEALRSALDRFHESQNEEFHSWVCTVMQDALQVRDLRSGRVLQVAGPQKDHAELLDLIQEELAPSPALSPETARLQLEGLSEAIRGVAASRSQRDACLAVLDAGMRVTRAESSSVIAFAAGRKTLRFLAARGPKAAEVLRYRLKPGQGIAGWCALRGQTLAIDEARGDARFYRVISEELGYETRSLLCVPIRRGRRVLGVVEWLNKPEGAAFTPEDVPWAETLASLLAPSLASR